MSRLMEGYRCCLETLIAYCCGYEGRELTPSDLTYTLLPVEQLDRLQQQYAVEDVYPLSPMQEGMLFHSLLDGDSEHYFEQITYRLEGMPDMAAVEKAVNELIRRYAILRTVFLYEGYDRPLQVVVKERKVDYYYQDVREECLSGDKESVIRTYQQRDRARKFDLSGDLLIRLAVLQTDRKSVV